MNVVIFPSILNDPLFHLAGSGLLVGTLVGDTYSVLFVAETPREEGDDEEVGAEGDAKKSEVSKMEQREVDVGWLSEHARQVARLLPGGLTLLGLFLPRPDMFLSANDGKLRKVLKAVASLDNSVPAELLILQSALSAKVLDSKTTSFKPLDVRTSSKPMELVRVESSLVLDIPVALPSCEDSLAEDIKPVLAKFYRLLDSATYIFDNKVLGSDTMLGKAVEVEKKKGKSKGVAKVETEDGEGEEEEKRQEVMKVELLMAEPSLDDVVMEEETSARMKLAGKLSCRAYLPPGANVAWAR